MGVLVELFFDHGREPDRQTVRLSAVFLGAKGKEGEMITDTFDRKTIAKMEVALERTCALLPAGSEKHSARRIIARKLIECAQRGDDSLVELTEAGYAAAMQLAASTQSGRKNLAARQTLCQEPPPLEPRRPRYRSGGGGAPSG